MTRSSSLSSAYSALGVGAEADPEPEPKPEPVEGVGAVLEVDDGEQSLCCPQSSGAPQQDVLTTPPSSTTPPEPEPEEEDDAQPPLHSWGRLKRCPQNSRPNVSFRHASQLLGSPVHTASVRAVRALTLESVQTLWIRSAFALRLSGTAAEAIWILGPGGAAAVTVVVAVMEAVDDEAMPIDGPAGRAAAMSDLSGIAFVAGEDAAAAAPARHAQKLSFVHRPQSPIGLGEREMTGLMSRQRHASGARSQKPQLEGETFHVLRAVVEGLDAVIGGSGARVGSCDCSG